MYKILVLSDLNDATAVTLKSAISLAKIINGDIELFSVKKPTAIVAKENQLSAMRSINREHTVMNKKIKNLIAPFNKAYGVAIHSTFAIGNIKNEIGTYIKKSQPDVIVLGKRKGSPFTILGASITQFVLNTFNGAVMIANDKQALEPNQEISLGVLNGLEPTSNLAFAKNLMEQTQKPMKSFKIVRNSSASKDESVSSNPNTVEYLFVQSNNAVKNLSKYLSKSNTDVLCLERAGSIENNSSNYANPDMKDITKNLNVTLLVTGVEKYNVAKH